MEVVLPVLGIVGVLLVGVVSPGPSFVFIAQRSMALTRSDGVWASLGMGLGGVFFAVLALLGLQLLMASVPLLYTVLRIAGGAYLVFLSYKIWKGSKNPLAVDLQAESGRAAKGRSFLLGLVTQVSNPKTAIVYSTVFATFLPGSYDARFVALLLAAVFVVEASWYSFVAVVLSTSRPREIYTGFKKGIDRVVAALLGALGTKLVVETILEEGR